MKKSLVEKAKEKRNANRLPLGKPKDAKKRVGFA